ncbi:hydrolase [bacterium]|nr:hydrolase [bacterium]MBU1072456.1 hydrolase [bacterium]MBU1675591.1 hydrolase [bacterium]
MPKPPRRLEKNSIALVVIDIQQLFRPLIHEADLVIANASRLIRFADKLDIPILLTEHYPQKLGPTVTELSDLIPRVEPIEKISFSCAGDHHFMSRLKSTHREQVVLCGIETHVCVYQTARDLLEEGYQVVVAADAVSSRQVSNRNLGLAYMRDIGVQVMTSEMSFFELLRIARTDDFRTVADILKENPRPGRASPSPASRKAGA